MKTFVIKFSGNPFYLDGPFGEWIPMMFTEEWEGHFEILN